MEAALLEAENISKNLGQRLVVDGVSLRCQRGQVLGLLGANGAGKSTSLRMCYGMLRPDGGSIRVAGHDLQGAPDLAMRQLGVCTQDDTFDGDFTVRDNLWGMGAFFRPKPNHLRERVDELLELFSLQQFATAKPETLSGGYRRRLGIARALVHRPQLIFLDEPTTGLDPEARMALWVLMNQLRDEGMGIVLTTHYMDEAHRLSDSLVILDAGKVIAEGSADAVLGQLIGEHLVVLNNSSSDLVPQVEAWLSEHRRPAPHRVLNEWHIPLDAPGLAEFTATFAGQQFEVRNPTLDDLFIRLNRRSGNGGVDY